MSAFHDCTYRPTAAVVVAAAAAAAVVAAAFVQYKAMRPARLLCFRLNRFDDPGSDYRLTL